MQATLTSRRDHNFRVNNRKENRVYNNKLITLYERMYGTVQQCALGTMGGWAETRVVAREKCT